MHRNVVGNVCGMYTGYNLCIEMWWERFLKLKMQCCGGMLHMGRDSIYLRTAFPKLGNKLPSNMLSYSIRL